MTVQYKVKKFGRGKGTHVFYMVTENNVPMVGTKCDFYAFAKRVLSKVKQQSI